MEPPAPPAPTPRPLWRHLLKLARPKQWAKCAFVLIGPLYALTDGAQPDWLAVAGAVLAFGFASSACYVFNDLRDREADRMHPRKCRRPIASGAVTPSTARAFALVLWFLALLPLAAGFALGHHGAVQWLAVTVGVYVLNVLLYSLVFKQVVILDVISLACGFVLRVLGGCAAAAVLPSPWLLNCTLFLAMFLAFGKRLGERRTMATAGTDVATARAVQSVYTDDLLRMTVVVTAVATLITYAGYVQTRGQEWQQLTHDHGTHGWAQSFYLLWLTLLPASYGMLRCIVLLERGDYDDPTELATGDRPFQAACVVFGAITLGVVMMVAKNNVAP